MKKLFPLLFLLSCGKNMTTITPSISVSSDSSLGTFFAPTDGHLHYIGRFEGATAYNAGSYITTRFRGTTLQVQIRDQKPGGVYNIVTVVIDGIPKRIRLSLPFQNINFSGLSNTLHTLVICKDTDSNEGYIELFGIRAQAIEYPLPEPLRRIEFYGDSQTSGNSMISPCTSAYDQADSYNSFGPLTARTLNAQWMLTSLAGIGLTPSGWGAHLSLPLISDKINMAGNSFVWDYRYRPDLVVVCVGQNAAATQSQFQAASLAYLRSLRSHYPGKQILVISSPMQPTATKLMQAAAWNNSMAVLRDPLITYHQIGKYYTTAEARCGSHPSSAQHAQIASELSSYIKTLMKW